MTTTEAPADRAESTAPRESPPWRPRGKRLLFGPPEQPRWARPALWALLVATLVCYLWGLSALGWANEYYAAAVQAGTQSWKALLFGSLDAGNAITVDKPPAALWVMGLSGRLLGFGTFSMLLPQALMAVGSVALLYAAVRRWSGPAAGLLAGGVLALTPVAVTMFRDNNPDALLVLLLVVAAYCVVRAIERGSGWWLAGAGVAVGFGFLTKLLQAFVVLPALAAAFLIAAPIGLWARIWKLLGAAVAVVVSAGWFLVLGTVWPADSRPYIGGSTNNSLLQLALGYNGLGRVFGGEGNGGPGGGPGGGGPGGRPGAMFGGDTGIIRLFRDAMGTEISWLLPAALIGLVALLWRTRATPRTGRTRAALVLWGGWLLVTGLVFSFMKGIIHPYYTVALAPAVAALIAVSVVELWRARASFTSRVILALMSAVTGVWAFVLLGRTPDWFPALRWVVLIGCVVVAVVIVAGAHRLGKWTAVLAVSGLLTGLGGPAAFAINNVAVTDSHTGGMPTSGPKTDRGGWGGPRPAGDDDGNGAPGGGTGTPGGDGGPGAPGTETPSGAIGNGDDAFRRTGPGASPSNAALNKLLEETDNRWAAAALGSHEVSSLELATGKSLLAIGGFSGGDPYPALARFQKYVGDGEIRYFIGGEQRAPGRSGPGADIVAWVKAHFTAIDVGGTTVYDLTTPVS
ncbi:ArnT family glycosyltransferase [Nocardia wallacei]|uniref:ArnT family glycosyltransferase n=1 Tax=Nocardia wallacei TaxID=480035 RepID=UPI00245862A8|nr:glycosyltransferase family 39 protein [Nocardia wallacei]